MSTQKKINAMHNNKRNWTMEQIICVAKSLDITWHNNGTSHYVFHHPSVMENLSIPKHKDIHLGHISRFLKFIDKINKN